MEQPKTHEEMIRVHSQDATLFGAMGAVTAELCNDVSREFVGKEFEFMDSVEFETSQAHLRRAQSTGGKCYSVFIGLRRSI
jgi:hypothetical protein